MERCEGIRHSKPIVARGMRLANFTIGRPNPIKTEDEGIEFSFQVPILSGNMSDPDINVQALRSSYLMIPLRLGSAKSGWKTFAWGGGVIRRERVDPGELRSTAVLSQSGDADLWIPVRFLQSITYSIIISSNASLKISGVSIVDSKNNTVYVCSGPTRLESELLCQWNGRSRDGRTSPAGSYRLVAQPAEMGIPPLNLSLRHDPKWLLP
jgi:hypothetical protein